MPDRTVRARIYKARRFQRDASRKLCNATALLCAPLIEVIGLYNTCRNFRGGPSLFGDTEIQTCSIVQCARTYSAKICPTPCNGKNFRSQIGPVESNEHKK